MDINAQTAAHKYAVQTYGTDNVQVDVEPGSPDGYDPTPDGVWVRAWVFVPANQIPGYSMEPPAPPSGVSVKGG